MLKTPQSSDRLLYAFKDLDYNQIHFILSSLMSNTNTFPTIKDDLTSILKLLTDLILNQPISINSESLKLTIASKQAVQQIFKDLGKLDLMPFNWFYDLNLSLSVSIRNYRWNDMTQILLKDKNRSLSLTLQEFDILLAHSQINFLDIFMKRAFDDPLTTTLFVMIQKFVAATKNKTNTLTLEHLSIILGKNLSLQSHLLQIEMHTAVENKHITLDNNLYLHQPDSEFELLLLSKYGRSLDLVNALNQNGQSSQSVRLALSFDSNLAVQIAETQSNRDIWFDIIETLIENNEPFHKVVSILEQNPSIRFEDFSHLLGDCGDAKQVHGILLNAFRKTLAEINAFEFDIQSISEGCALIQDDLRVNKEKRIENMDHVSKVCCICDAQFKLGSKLVQYPCGHKRHLECEKESNSAYCSLCSWRLLEVSDDLFEAISEQEFEQWCF